MQSLPDLAYMQIFVQRKDFKPASAGGLQPLGLSWLIGEVLKAVPRAIRIPQVSLEDSPSSLSYLAPNWPASASSETLLCPENIRGQSPLYSSPAKDFTLGGNIYIYVHRKTGEFSAYFFHYRYILKICLSLIFHIPIFSWFFFRTET